MIALLKEHNVPYCPTLTRELSTFIYEDTPGFFRDPFFLREPNPQVMAFLQEPERQEAMRKNKSARAYKAALPTAEKNLKKLSDAGIPIVMGTDSRTAISGGFAGNHAGSRGERRCGQIDQRSTTRLDDALEMALTALGRIPLSPRTRCWSRSCASAFKAQAWSAS